MKELSIKEKARRYDKALEIARKLNSGECVESLSGWTVCEVIFPELKESEDEKNIKNLIDELKCSLRAANCQNDACGGGDEKRIALLEWGIAWLEKQGEQKPVDKTEPKFKVGDWITNGATKPAQISSIEDDMYYTHNGTIGGDIESMDKDYHLWTIADAKDGDVLVSKYNKPFIYNGNHNYFTIGSYCGISIDNKFKVATEKCNWAENTNIYPATKEQRDTLMKAIADAGYTFNFDKKELKMLI